MFFFYKKSITHKLIECNFLTICHETLVDLKKQRTEKWQMSNPLLFQFILHSKKNNNWVKKNFVWVEKCQNSCSITLSCYTFQFDPLFFNQFAIYVLPIILFTLKVICILT